MSLRPDFQWPSQLEADVQHGLLNASVPSTGRHRPAVVHNDSYDHMLHTVRGLLKDCDEFAFSIAFVNAHALAMLKQDFIECCASGTITTSTYLNFNQPAAFAELLKLQRFGVQTRIVEGASYHPKGYFFRHGGIVTALIGSSNLTQTGLTQNREWNLKVSATTSSDLAAQLERIHQLQEQESFLLDDTWVKEYQRTYVPPAPPAAPAPQGVDSPTRLAQAPAPNAMQVDALQRLSAIRDDGERNAMVISATGTGKTMLSAFDVQQVDPNRLLFVVHREQILDRTIQEFRTVLGGPPTDYGKLGGGTDQSERRYVFATVQTLSHPQALQSFSPDSFDYIIFDEAHRMGAAGHQRVMAHFSPEFYLGMTATPERTDGFNIFELFDYNVAYEIRLNEALEEQMLCPFQYYGITDVTYDDGTTVGAESDLSDLGHPSRVTHVLRAMHDYGIAGVAPRGLVFCSRRDEAAALSSALNERLLNGQRLRTLALTGEDSVEDREHAVRMLENGDLDYILTVDIFNEGVDIPSVNQVVMLRQTQSAIIFVQQMGRGLRLHNDKDFLVVIDVIGNYTNNFLIPIALFGDNSLNKESLRKQLVEAEESGVVSGVSSVRFDKVAKQRVMDSLTQTKLDSVPRLKEAVRYMMRRVGRTPTLYDFVEHDSVDPVLLATKNKHFPALLTQLLKLEPNLSSEQERVLNLLSHDVLPAQRAHETVILQTLLQHHEVSIDELKAEFQRREIPATENQIRSAIATLTLSGHSEVDRTKYVDGVANFASDDTLQLTKQMLQDYVDDAEFAAAVDDLIRTSSDLVDRRYDQTRTFTPARQYSRREVARCLNWPKSKSSTIYGYRVDYDLEVCPIFVTLHKSEDIQASVAYEDALLDPRTMRWFSRPGATLQSREIAAIVSGDVDLPIFVKKDDAEGPDFYFLGMAAAHEAVNTTVTTKDGDEKSAVTMELRFEEPVDGGLYEYFHPEITQE